MKNYKSVSSSNSLQQIPPRPPQQQSKDLLPYYDAPTTCWTTTAITEDYDRDDVSPPSYNEEDEESEQRSEINSVHSDGSRLSLPRKLFSRVALPVTTRQDHVRDAFDGKNVVITVSPHRRRKEDRLASPASSYCIIDDVDQFCL
jgi:hypothetical protein